MKILSPVEAARLREKMLAHGLRTLAKAHGISLREPLSIDERGEFKICAEPPANCLGGAYPGECGVFGKAFSELLTRYNPRCGVMSGATIIAENGWCRMNHFDVERMLNEWRNSTREKMTQFSAWLGERSSYKPEEVPSQFVFLTNDVRSALEVLEFMANPPKLYFAYVKTDKEDKRISAVSTWTGDLLSEAGSVWQGALYQMPAFGRASQRINFRFRGINGRTYSGTYYKSTGDYCRFREVKS